MSARDLAAFIADLRNYTSGVERARYAYAIDMAAQTPAEPKKPRPITDRKCPDCGTPLARHRKKCDDCANTARRRIKREQMRRMRARRKEQA